MSRKRALIPEIEEVGPAVEKSPSTTKSTSQAQVKTKAAPKAPVKGGNAGDCSILLGNISSLLNSF